ncbi:MAG TPA: BatA and WFA domain-containing protein [Pyrinomonadaceae bacterium]|nr:BatA and WFA domain-containing protein [Pyrinomonadaceae bacterium]
MSFLSPIAMVALSMLALPVVIHLLARRNARRLDFPSLRFLRETPSFKLRLRRVREPLLLMLRVAALALLVIGFARPLIVSRASQKHNRVILIDASLSMRARGRTEAAREQARSIVNKLGTNDQAAIVSFTNNSSVLAPLTAERNLLAKAIEQYQPSSGSVDYAAAIRAANEMLPPAPQASGEIDLISDFQQSGLAGARKPDERNAQVVAYPTGATIERNAFLADEEVTRTEHGVEVSANEIVAGEDGRSGARNRWAIEQAAGAGSGIEWKTEENGQVTGHLSALEPDDFDADDERYFAFTLPRERRALLVESDADASIFLRAALESALSSNGTTRTELSAQRELPRDAEELKKFSLVVVTLQGSPRADDIKILADYARAGGTVWMLLARELDTDAWSAFASTGQGSALPFTSLSRFANQSRSFGAIDEGAPQVSSLDDNSRAGLRAVEIRAGFSLSSRDSASVLIRWNDNSAASLASRIGDGNILILGASPDRASGNLGLSPALPALASSILRSSTEAREPIARTLGEPLILSIAPDEDVRVTDSRGNKFSAKARQLMASPQKFFAQPGVFRLETGSGALHFLAFNSPGSESERELASAEQIKKYLEGAGNNQSQVNGDERGTNLEQRSNAWRYFLGAAFLLLVAELFYAFKRQRARNILSETSGEEASA